MKSSIQMLHKLLARLSGQKMDLPFSLAVALLLPVQHVFGV